MAKRIFALSGIISVDGLRGAVDGLKTLDKQFRQAEKALLKFGRQTAHAGAILTKNITLPITILGGVVTKFGSDFEKSMTTSTAIMGDLSDEMRTKLSNTARDVAKTTTFTAASAAKAFYFLSSAGYSAADAIGALPKVAKFAAAGQMDLEMSTSLLADAQNALGLKVDDTVQNIENLTRVSDVLSEANNMANGSVQDFALALANKGAAALKMVNKEVEEGVAVLAAYASVGVKGEEAGDKLNIVLRDLQTQAIKHSRAFKDAGVSVYDASGKMLNMADIVASLENKLSGMSDEEKRATFMTLGFQDRSVAATMQLIGMSNAIREYEAKLKSAAGVTEDVAKKQMQNFQDQLTILWHRVQDVSIELYSSLQPILMNDIIPAFEKAASKIEKVAKWFTSLDADTKKNIISFIGFTAILGPFLLVLGKTILAVGSVKAAIVGLRTAVLALNAAMLTNPFVMVIVGAGVLAAALYGAKKAYDNLIESHREYEIMTKDQAKVKEFTEGIAVLTKKIQTLGDALNDEKVLNAELGDETTKLTEKARELGYVLEGNNKEKIDGLLIIDQELRGVRDATGALVRYTRAKKESGKVDTKGSWAVKKTEEELKAIERLNQESRDRIAKATLDDDELFNREVAQAVEQAKKIGADVSLVQQSFILERVKQRREEIEKNAELQQKEKEESADLEKSWTTMLMEQEGDRLKIIEQNRIDAVKEAMAKGIAIENINKYFDRERIKAEKEIKQKRMQDFEDVVNKYIGIINNIGNGIAGIMMQATANKEVALDNQQQAERDAIDNSLMSEKEKRKALSELDKKQDKEQRDLRRKAAKENKAIAIFDSIIGTAAAITQALPNLILAGIVGVIGGIKTALIASQPLPLARGAMVKGQRGGIMAQIGEGMEDEVVLPLKSGVQAIAENLISLMREQFMPSLPVPLAFAGGGQSPYTGINRSVENHWHIGTLVADDRGIKELERRMLPYRVSELQRKGQSE